MPTTSRKPQGPTDLDYDLAMLHEPLTDETLTILDAVLDARDASGELASVIARAQRTLEAGPIDFDTRDAIAQDLLDLTATLRASAIRIVG